MLVALFHSANLKLNFGQRSLRLSKRAPAHSEMYYRIFTRRKFMFRKLIGLTLGAVLTLPVTANAAIWTFSGALNSDQESTHALVLPSPYFGGGALFATLDDASGDYVLDVLFTGLTGPVTDAHIHLGAPGVAGPVVMDLGAPETIVPGYLNLHFASVLSALEIDTLTGSGTNVVGAVTPVYVNVHTAANPAGEIRGQLFVATSPVPIPPAMWMMGSALVGLITLRRRT